MLYFSDPRPSGDSLPTNKKRAWEGQKRQVRKERCCLSFSVVTVQSVYRLIVASTRSTRGAAGGLPYKKGGDARREISIEPLKGTDLGVA